MQKDPLYKEERKKKKEMESKKQLLKNLVKLERLKKLVNILVNLLSINSRCFAIDGTSN